MNWELKIQIISDSSSHMLNLIPIQLTLS